MKKIHSLFVSGILLASLSACSSKSTDSKTSSASPESIETSCEEVPDHHTAALSLDYPGVYEGIIPAASGPGIKMTLILHKNNTFELRSEYIDEKEGIFTEKGNYVINGNVVTLELPDSEKKYFKVEEGRVRMLTSDQKRVEGALADHYILQQITVF